MKLSQNWLQEVLKTKLSTEKLADQLTMAGLEVDGVKSVADPFSDVVVGRVVDVKRHPDADKLSVCKVNVGAKELLEIVCGAKNVRANLKVAVAIIGADLNGFKIKKAKLRGIISHGMICSEKELGLSESAEGIMELPKEAPIGKNIRDYLSLNDVSININLTPNRGDAASVFGIAREVAAINRLKYRPPMVKKIKPMVKETLKIALKTPAHCPHYAGRIIRQINPKAVTPLWMQERLRRSDIHCIHPVVDVTNYVLLELGQPMHAFDLAKLSDFIQVRLAKPKEKLTLLDGEKIELTRDSLVIADKKSAVALAGVMGGLDSSVTEKTTDIFLESAYFNPITIFKSAKQFGLQTDSSYRFERGVDFKLQALAIERATELLLEIVGGKPGPIIDVMDKKQLPNCKVLTLRPGRISALLGTEIPEKMIKEILNYLGMSVKKRAKVWKITVPSFRFDLNIEADLIEEIARIYGYNRLPVIPKSMPLIVKSVTAKTKNLRYFRDLLKDLGYQEIVTYSFVDPVLQRKLNPQVKGIALTNPIADNMHEMRTSLWPGLLEAFSHNFHRQQARIRLFEAGKRFCLVNGKLEEQVVLSGLIYGSRWPEQWSEKSQSVDFFDLKGDVERLIQSSDFVFKPGKHPALHFGQTAELFKENQPVGYFGAIHPLIAQSLNVSPKIYLFELLFDSLRKITVPVASEISKFPVVRRDLALVVDKNISANRIEKTIRKVIGLLLIDLVIFDLYEDKKMQINEKSVALGLTLQAPSRTLTDREVCDIIEQVIEILKSNLGAKLRD